MIMYSNNQLVPTTEETVKEVISNLETDKPQAYQTKKKPISNESNKGMALNKSSSLDKSRSSPRTEIENTLKPLKKQDQFHQPVYLIKIPKSNNQKKENL